MTTGSVPPPAPRAWAAVGALATILVVTAAWWALALWPAGNTSPAWLLRTRDVCFGTAETGLPNAGGWILLIGQPLGMLLVLVAVWREELRAGLSRLLVPIAGQVVVGAAAAAMVAGLTGVVVRVAGAGTEPFSPGRTRDLAGQLTRVNQAAPAMRLVDQHGQDLTLDDLRGRPVLVTFAYAHCETICPLIVSDVIAAGRRLADDRPAVVVITLDPWRDTPSRLAPMAAAWGLEGDARVLSGEPDVVERALNAWRVPRVRNEKTGDLSHPSLVYVLDRNGRIAYVVTGGADVITAAVRSL